ncbi:MAG: hypothetical protein V2A58_07180 [Planctomycetota bacterium]
MLIEGIWTVMALVGALVAGGYLAAVSADESAVAWAAEFDGPADLAAAKLTRVNKSGGSVPGPEIEDVKVEDGVLHLGGTFGPDSHPGDYVFLSWGWNAGDAPLLEGGKIDIPKYPILEVRWRMEPKFAPYDVSPQYNLLWAYELPDGSASAAYTTGPYRNPGQWVVEKVRFAPDSSVPSQWTPSKVTGIRLEIGARMCREPAWIDVDYIRIRALTPEEAAEEEVRIQVLKRPAPEIPTRLRDIFFYGVYGRPPYVGGWEGTFDELVRCHMNTAFAVGGDLAEIAGAAKPLGVYIIASPSGGLTNKLEAEGREPVEKAVADLAAKTADLTNIVGWYIRDEPLMKDLWGVVGVKEIFDRLDGDRLGLFIVHSWDIVRYYDRFTTVAWTDRYPMSTGRRDPWSISEWCRRINEVSARRQWFTPQAFGDAPAYRAKTGFDYYCPTPEEFRLMMHLAMANGAKAFGIFIHYLDLAAGMADPVGNPTGLMKEAAAIGEKWMAIGPLLLDARPVTGPTVTAPSQSAGKRGVSVGALGDPGEGPVFLVATNEDLEAPQGGEVRLPDAWAAPDRAVYDLYALRKVSENGATALGVEPLDPGDGRIYLLASGPQFAAVSARIVANAVEESLRVQGADRLIAERWGLDLTEYNAVARRARAAAESGGMKPASEARDKAEAILAAVMAADKDLALCRDDIEVVKRALGKAWTGIYLGCESIRPGREDDVALFKSRCQEYNALRRRYVLGQKDSLSAEAQKLRREAEELAAHAPSQ